MDETLQTEIRQVVQQPASAQQTRLAEAATLLSPEELTTRIGDEFTRRLTERQLRQRGRQAFLPPQDPCPDGGPLCPVQQELEAVILQSRRGGTGIPGTPLSRPLLSAGFFPPGR